LTNSEFAEAVGCDVTTASRYRNGHRLPGVELLESIEALLGMPHDELMRVWHAGRAWHRKYPKRPQDNPFGKMLRDRVFDSDGDEAVA
jgi:transcriptional regulator with XRE-family HTH domain